MSTIPSTTGNADAERTGPQPVSLATQLRVFAALGVAGAVFWTAGWMVLQPADPGAPVTLLAASHPLTAFVVLAALAGVAGGLAVIIAGRAPLLIAPAAVGAGLAALSIRGASSDLLGITLLSRTATPRVWPTASLVIELWAWLALVVLGGVVGKWVAGRVLATDPLAAGLEGKATHSLLAQSGRLAGSIGISFVLIYVLVSLLGGSAVDEVLRGQVFFSVGMATGLAVCLSQVVLRCEVSWWPVAAVALAGAAAYVLGQPSAAGGSDMPFVLRVMPNVVSRPLPIEFAAWGAIGAAAGAYMSRPTMPAANA